MLTLTARTTNKLAQASARTPLVCCVYDTRSIFQVDPPLCEVDLSDVSDAMEVIGRMKGIKHKSEYCFSVGIDYHRVKTYHSKVMTLEKILAATPSRDGRRNSNHPNTTLPRPSQPPSVPTLKPAPTPAKPFSTPVKKPSRTPSPPYLIFLLICSLLSDDK